MKKTRYLTFMVSLVFLAVCSQVTQGKLFVLKDKETSKPCILVDVDFVLDLAAVKGKKVVAKAEVSSDDEGIRVSGSCGDISGVLDLFYPNGVNWVLKFRQDEKKQAYLNRIIQFIPQKVFGKAVPVIDYQLMDDRGVTDLGNATNSYECPVPETVKYQPVTVTTNTTNFTATADVSYFHAQAFNVYNSSFSPAVLCKAALTTTSAPKVNTTLPAVNTTEVVNTTTSPTPKPAPSKPPVKLYTVKQDGITCIALKAALTLNIKYPVEGKGKTKMTKLFVPEDATSRGTCNLTATTQELSISFYKNWKLNFYFSSNPKNSIVPLSSSTNGKHPRYKISRIEVFGLSDKTRFPGTTWPENTPLNFTNNKSNFPEVPTAKKYYKCVSNLDTKLTSEASVESQQLEVKAFNADNNADFTGPAAQCAADSGSSRKKTYIIVGCVLAAIVVLSFIVFVVMRVMKKRRENYHTLQ